VSAVVADTHALVWYISEPSRLSKAARDALNGATQSGEPIYVASVSHVEMRYLTEKGRIDPMALDRVDALLDAPNSALIIAPLDLRIARAVLQIARAEVPDMPDRIIAATALVLQLPLVTRDRKIQSAAIVTIW
jgi:PIN domain nuclease of toxin-antitoxin system